MDIKDWLESVGIKKYSINVDVINVDQSVDISGLDLVEIPFKFGKINGDFDCSNNKLRSLNNSPYEITGSFDCSNNKLSDLVNGPRIVTEAYIASDNQLSSLKGIGKFGGIDISDNKELKSLIDLPKKIFGAVNASYCSINTLVGGPTEIQGDFDVSHNQLSTLEGCPTKLMSSFFVSHNQLSSLKGVCDSIGFGFSGDFDISNNKLNDESFKDIKIKVNGKIIVGGNRIKKKNELENVEAKKIVESLVFGNPTYPSNIIGDYKKITECELLPTFSEFIANKNQLNQIPGGKGQNRKSNEFDKFELVLGRKVELEHFCTENDITENDKLNPKLLKKAEEIAIDHLSENDNYYSDGFIKGLFDEDIDDVLNEYQNIEKEKISLIRRYFKKK